MNDSATALLLLAGTVGGSAAAFMVVPQLLFVYLIFAFSGSVRLGGSWIGRTLLMMLAPAALMVLGLARGNESLSLQATRWIAALCSGSYLAAETGTERMVPLLRRASRRLPLASGLFGLLAAVLKLTGIWIGRARKTYLSGRREGLGMAESIRKALGSLSLGALDEPDPSADPVGVFPKSTAILAWCLLLVGIVQV
ncbi:hypothetical protein GF402_10730 [Candidatus Fermentibacteria bacterium]|nr:hypothetical protein [Candidatus Fermentibacteria bacterium]